MRLRLLPPAVFLAACTGPGAGGDSTAPPVAPRPAAALADMGLWALGVDDPEPAHAPVDAGCPEAGWGLEGAALEVSTGTCTYAVLEQPLLGDLQPGDRVEVVWWHNQLVADAPATGHLLLAVGGQALYEREVAIPASADAYTETVTVGTAAAVGEPLVLHLHNHGANDWTLLRVERLASDAPAGE